jgi:phosphoenolpyruvate carboxylase
MNMISAEHAAENYGMHTPPLFEVILPMTTSADQLIQLQKRFSRIAEATENIFDMKSVLKHIELIPLFEEIGIIAHSDEILQKYVDFLQTEYNYKPEYLRVFIARSDPAMNAGLVPTMMTIKEAISKYHAFGDRNGIQIYPWIGGGSLPFRGAINPENIREAIDEYKGTASVTIQSAFRADYPLEDVKSAIALLNLEIPKNMKHYLRVTPEECQQIEQFGQEAGMIFKSTIEEIADTINFVAAKLPSHRERVQHVGLFGYSRGVGKVTLPRAIKFTGSLYSLGIPPEFISTGRVLRLAEQQGILPLVKKLYVNLKRDMVHAGKYLNKENLDLLCNTNPEWKPIREDIREIEKILNIELGPETDAHYLHRNFTSNIYRRYRMGTDFSSDILEAAKLRKSLG